jgi:hypothetical protein
LNISIEKNISLNLFRQPEPSLDCIFFKPFYANEKHYKVTIRFETEETMNVGEMAEERDFREFEIGQMTFNYPKLSQNGRNLPC